MVKKLLSQLKALFDFLFNALFPPSEEALIVSRLTDAEVELLYRPHIRNNVLMLSHFNDARVRALVHEAKFHSNTKAIEYLGLLLTYYFESEQLDEKVLVVPVPLHPARSRARGYNQVEKVVKAALEHVPSRIRFERKVLKRIRNTKPQTELKKEERAKNVAGAFRLNDAKVIEGKPVLLLDDVVTTGSTLREAKRELEKANPQKVLCVSLSG